MIRQIIKKRKEISLTKFKELPYPSQKSESWKYTNLSNFKLEEIKQTTQEIEFIGLTYELKEKGVIFTSINDAINNHFEIMSEHLPMGLVNYDEDKLTAMHAAYFNDGVFIYVPKNVSLNLPLRNIFNTINKGGIFSHTLIILETGASLDYVEEHVSTNFEELALRNDVVEIYAKDNSKINFHNFQNWNNNVKNISNWKAKLKKDAIVNFYLGQFGGVFSRIKIDLDLVGQGSSSDVKGVFFANKNQHFDITTNINHNVPNTNGDILIKGVLDDESTSVYRGMIKILKNAQNTNSYLSDQSLILSDKTKSNSIPSLEIDANEVKASHGATIGKPSEEELFYLMARGLSRIDAERLIILGYFSPITKNINIEDLKNKFNEVLNSKVR